MVARLITTMEAVLLALISWGLYHTVTVPTPLSSPPSRLYYRHTISVAVACSPAWRLHHHHTISVAVAWSPAWRLHYHHTIPMAVACSPAWRLHHPPSPGSRAARLPARLLPGASPPSQEQSHRAAQGIPSRHCPRSCHTPGAAARTVSVTPHFRRKTAETHFLPSSSSAC